MKFRNLTADDVEVRIGQCSEKGASLLLFKDSRVDCRILDETVGSENWDCQYAEIGGNLYCSIGIYCEMADGHMEWVYKQDVGVPSNMEAEKGAASDALKRAAFRWGIGRELYTAPFIWIPADKLKTLRKNDRTGRFQCYDRFRVKRMAVKDGRIAELSIADEKGVLVWGNPFDDMKAEKAEARKNRFAKVKELKAEALGLGIKESGIKSWLDTTFGKPMKDFSDAEIRQTEDYLASLIRDKKALNG
jgi:hypothetical protein